MRRCATDRLVVFSCRLKFFGVFELYRPESAFYQGAPHIKFFLIFLLVTCMATAALAAAGVWRTVVGLELHVQLRTAHKLFSSSPLLCFRRLH